MARLAIRSSDIFVFISRYHLAHLNHDNRFQRYHKYVGGFIKIIHGRIIKLCMETLIIFFENIVHKKYSYYLLVVLYY